MTIIGGLQLEGKIYLAWDSWLNSVPKHKRHKQMFSKQGSFSNGVLYVTTGYLAVSKIAEQQFIPPTKVEEQDDYEYMLDFALAYKQFCSDQKSDKDSSNHDYEFIGLNEYILAYKNKLYRLADDYTIYQIDDVHYAGIGTTESYTVDYLFNSSGSIKVDSLSQLDIFKLAIASACDINDSCDRPYFIYNVTDGIVEEYK